jgi:hypothetical protein
LNETGPIRATAAASEGDLIIGGRKPIVSTVCTISRPEMGRRSISAPATSLTKGAMVTRRRSHQRNTLTIDSVFETPEDLMAQTQLTPSFQSQFSPSFQPSVITPDVISGFLRPNVFENLPARSSRSIYDDSLGFGSSSMGSNDYARFSPTSMIVLE